MRDLYLKTTPLAASEILTTEWFSMDGEGDIPYLTIQINTDQLGTLTVQETESPFTNESVHTLTGLDVRKDMNCIVSVRPTRRFVRCKYENGSTAQTSFTMTISSTLIAKLPDRKLLELILRELKIMNVQLKVIRKGSSNEHLNLPIGLD
jgi:hypothetical protein